MSFYVHRRRASDGREGWVGPIRSERQADREVAAWKDAGWESEWFVATPDLRKRVNAWQREADKRLGRTR